MHKKLQIEYWPLSRLVPYARNPRVNDKAVAKMIASITEYGFSVPCLARSNGEVVDGHLRLKAAMAMQLAEVPVIVCDGWTEAQVKAFRLMVNRSVTWADWDLEALTAEFMDLKALDFDLVQTGFDIAEINRFTIAPNPAEDEVPPVPEAPVTITGDLWLLGEHRLVCGDATNADDVSKLLDGRKPFLMVTDPPYGVEYDPEWRVKYDSVDSRAIERIRNDDRIDWTPAWALFPGDACYVWHAGVYAGQLEESLHKAAFIIRAQIIWRKQHFVFGRGAYHWQHEPCWYAVRKGKGANWRGDRQQTTIWDVANLNPMGGERKDATGHSTQKPVEVMRRPIINHTVERDEVYDPFLGSGTTLIAAELTARKCYGLELDTAYCDVIVTRWQNLTGKQAIHAATGATFEHVQHGRRMAAEDALKEDALSHDHKA